MYAHLLTLTSCAQLERNPRGLSTCSRTSIEHTTSNDAGPTSARRSSTEVCLYVSEPRVEFMPPIDVDSAESAEAWSEAIDMLEDEASIPVVCAPRRARLCGRSVRQCTDCHSPKQSQTSLSSPPPHPTSSTRRPRRISVECTLAFTSSSNAISV